MRRLRRCLALLSLLLATHGSRADPPPAGPHLSPEAIARSVLEDMDLSADPCGDFYRYACGAWLDRARMPADRTRWTRSFASLTEANRSFLRRAVEEAAADPGDDPDRRKVGDFYAACMDEGGIEAAGTAPLLPWLERIATVEDAATLLAVAGELYRVGASPLFGFYAAPDPEEPSLTIAHLSQGGLGMPERDYYVSPEPRQRELLASYERHVARVLELVGRARREARKEARGVVALEAALAHASRTAVELRRPEELVHRLDRSGLSALTPRLAWERFFAGAGAPELSRVNVATPRFFTALERLAATTRPATLRAYLTWHLLNWSSPSLPERFVAAKFDFYGRTLSGQQEIEPRWKRCVALTAGALSEAVGKLYVAERFAGDSRERALALIGDVRRAFAQSLPGLAWMDEETRRRAGGKQEALAEVIGYPERWRDYSALAVSRQSHFANLAAAGAFEVARQLAKVGKPVDRREWSVPPQLVNAGYNPALNRITFPAGILQPPFFHRDFPAAMNYGAIGTVMGHEVTHGFDDEGRKYDREGRLVEWWAPEVAARFEQRAACLERQFSRYEVEPGLTVDGALTLGENIADAGGLKQAWRAYELWQARQGGPGPGLGPLADDQLFFVAHAQVWCELVTPEAARLAQKTDVHAPGRYRVIGPIVNHPAFAAAFACAAGTPMNPEEKCEVW
jgi:predicted metalloendopeptidase